MNRTLKKVLITTAISFFIVCGALLSYVFIALASGSALHLNLALGFWIILWFLLMLQTRVMEKTRLRMRRLGFASLVLVLITGITAGIQLWPSLYDQVEEAEVNLLHFQPFTASTRTVSLDEEATLRLSENLPRLDGATALYPVYAAFVQAVYPEAVYRPYWRASMDEAEYRDYIKERLQDPEYRERMIADGEDLDPFCVCSTTSEAFKRLIKGDADIIFTAQPSQGDLRLAEEAGVELKLTPIGSEAFVFFVSSSNPISGLSSEDLRAIYAGEITNWREVGGRNSAIRAFQRPVNSGSQTMLIAFMGGRRLMPAPSEDVAGGMGGMVHRVTAYRNYPGAIGYSFLYYVDEMLGEGKLKLLAVDGVAPTRQAVAESSYPLAAHFYAITAGSENPHVVELIDWILSPQGQQLVAKTGYTPLAAR